MIHIALTATQRNERSVICLELRPEDSPRAAVWPLITELLAGFDNGCRRIGKVTPQGARVEIECTLPWKTVLAELQSIATRLAPVDWTYHGDSTVLLAARAV